MAFNKEKRIGAEDDRTVGIKRFSLQNIRREQGLVILIFKQEYVIIIN
mgnify:CR=1 FL=1